MIQVLDGDEDWERLLSMRALAGRLAGLPAKAKRGSSSSVAQSLKRQQKMDRYWRERSTLEELLGSILDFLEEERFSGRKQQQKKSTPSISFTRL